MRKYPPRETAAADLITRFQRPIRYFRNKNSNRLVLKSLSRIREWASCLVQGMHCTLLTVLRYSCQGWDAGTLVGSYPIRTSPLSNNRSSTSPKVSVGLFPLPKKIFYVNLKKGKIREGKGGTVLFISNPAPYISGKPASPFLHYFKQFSCAYS